MEEDGGCKYWLRMLQFPKIDPEDAGAACPILDALHPPGRISRTVLGGCVSTLGFTGHRDRCPPRATRAAGFAHVSLTTDWIGHMICQHRDLL
jgi:hypothetical protein